MKQYGVSFVGDISRTQASGSEPRASAAESRGSVPWLLEGWWGPRVGVARGGRGANPWSLRECQRPDARTRPRTIYKKKSRRGEEQEQEQEQEQEEEQEQEQEQEEEEEGWRRRGRDKWVGLRWRFSGCFGVGSTMCSLFPCHPLLCHSPSVPLSVPLSPMRQPS